MSKDREAPVPTSNSSGPAYYDQAPGLYQADNPGDHFSGASGVLFEQAMAQTRMAVCLCDPKKPDMPIVFANRAFRALTGYDESEIVGHNCRFLQGPKTDQREVEKIRVALRQEEVVVVELLNYRKDGTPFWNALHLGPIYRPDGELMYFFGSQWDVSEVRAAREDERTARIMARELSHRMKNMFSVISGIVNVTGRVRGVPEEAAEINGRIQALGRAYETTLDEASSGTIEIGPAIRAILAPYDADEDRLRFLGNGLRVHFSTVSVVGLVLHELAANATKYGAWFVNGGRVDVDWGEVDGGGSNRLYVRWCEYGVPALGRAPVKHGSGTQIVDRMLRHGGGSIQRTWTEHGLEATIEVPA